MLHVSALALHSNCTISCSAQSMLLESGAFRRSVELALAGVTDSISGEGLRQIIAIFAVCKAEQGTTIPFWLADGLAPYPDVPSPCVTCIPQERGDTTHDWQGVKLLLRKLNDGFWSSGPGYLWSRHRCSSCLQTAVINGSTVAVYASCLDGVTPGHCCCSVPGCTVDMASGWDKRYRELHANRELLCAINGCEALAESTDSAEGCAKSTCPDHWFIEFAYNRQREKGGFMARLEPGSEAAEQVSHYYHSS
jgi:CxC6 like cysteine cluster associated with KDZ transposases